MAGGKLFAPPRAGLFGLAARRDFQLAPETLQNSPKILERVALLIQ